MNEQITEKIRKMMRLQQGATTEGEAAACAARIADLCAKHNLEIGSIRLEQEQKEAKEVAHVTRGVFKSYWAFLSSAVEQMFDVGSYRSLRYGDDGNKQTHVVFFGLAANIESAKITYEYLLASVEAMLQGWIREQGAAVVDAIRKGSRVPSMPTGVAAHNSFRIGCASRIMDRVAEQVRLQKAQIQGDSEAMAIVLISDKLTKAHGEKLKLKTERRGVSVRDRGAYGAGYAAGGRVDLHGARSSRMLR